MKPDTADMEHISAIKIFHQITKHIREIGIYPLSFSNLNIQQDAYKRLAAGEEYEGFEIFATLEQSQKQKDTDLRFMVEFLEVGIILSIEDYDHIQLEYSDIGPSNDEVSNNIILALMMLSNGQLSCLLTLRNKRLCATELIYKSNSRAIATTIAISTYYPLIVRDDSVTSYDIEILKNTFKLQTVKMPEVFFLGATTPNMMSLELNRKFENNISPPYKECL